jgi:hypothetical protein
MYERVSSRLYRRYGNTWKALTEITVSFSIRFAAQCSLHRPIAELERRYEIRNIVQMYTLPVRRPIAELEFGDLYRTLRNVYCAGR